VFSLRYGLLVYVLFRRLLCVAVLHFNVLDVAAFLDTSQHSLEATEENHEDAVRNVYCFGVSSQLEMFFLAEYQRLNCQMVIDVSVGHIAYALLPWFSSRCISHWC